MYFYKNRIDKNAHFEITLGGMTTYVKPIYYHNIIKNDQIKCCILPQEMLANMCIYELSVLDYCTILDHHGLTSPLFLAQQWHFPPNPNIRQRSPLLRRRQKREKGRAKEKAREERRTPAWRNTKISAFMECVSIWRSWTLILVCEFHAVLLLFPVSVPQIKDLLLF